MLRDTKEFVKASGGEAASGISHHCYIGVQKYTYILKAEDNVMKEIREPRVMAFSRGGNWRATLTPARVINQVSGAGGTVSCLPESTEQPLTHKRGAQQQQVQEARGSYRYTQSTPGSHPSFTWAPREAPHHEPHHSQLLSGSLFPGSCWGAGVTPGRD